MKQIIQSLFAGIVKQMGVDNAVIVVTVPENPDHGDYTTNIAMLLAGRLKAPPLKIAQQIVDSVKLDQKNSLIPWLASIEVAPPGFINLTLTEATLGKEIGQVLSQKDRYGAVRYTNYTHGDDTNTAKNDDDSTRTPSHEKNDKKSEVNSDQKNTKSNNESDSHAEKSEKSSKSEFGNDKNIVRTGQKIMVEFAHPNTHKAFHIGHLRNITTGESIVRLLEASGSDVVRANYQGDVGMHIAKALYALLNVSPFKEEVSGVTGVKNRVEFLGKAYAAGSGAYEASDEVKKIIGEINKKIYAKDPSLYDLYKETRQWSLDYFESIYARVGSHFDRYYFESEMFEKGKQFVLDHVKNGIFEESKGAVIFPGEKYGLHNRVFITSEGNATYEGKEVALGRVQFDEYHPDLIIHCVGPEQAGYFQVLFKALEQVFPDTIGKEYHLIYGWVKLKEGKMSSRLGNVILGEWLMEEVKKEVLTIIESTHIQNDIDKDAVSEALAIGAIKYAFLKVSTQQEIAFDLKESINTNGDSGPYLMYAYARCKSVLRKAEAARQETGDRRQEENDMSLLSNNLSLNGEERLVARMIMQFSDVVADAATRLSPNILCTYLFQLASQYNTLYAKHTIADNQFRLALTAATAQVLKNGLHLLGIATIERM